MISKKNVFRDEQDPNLFRTWNRNIWMHSIDRPEGKNATADIVTSYAILIAFILLVGLILYASSEYHYAYPDKQKSEVTKK